MKFKRPLIITGLTLLIPLIAMQLSDNVVWDWLDFLIAGVLLATASISYELLTGGTDNRTKRLVIGATILLIVAVIWAELAVGLFGTPFAGS